MLLEEGITIAGIEATASELGALSVTVGGDGIDSIMVLRVMYHPGC